MLNKTEYAYVANGGTLGAAADTITYGYESEYQAWADQLTSYDGEAIRYDASGNPTTYRGYTMAWQGRRLTGATNGTNTISYSYDENGIRTQKTVNGTVTNYNYHGSALISQVTGNDTLLFSYDAAGNAMWLPSTIEEANILVEWAEELGFDTHLPETHPNRSGIWSYTLHIVIRNLHIRVFE